MPRAIGVLNHNHSYVHVQGVAASVWVINHNLNRKPSITIVDSADSVVGGDPDYIDENTIIITFNASFAGKAYLN